MEEYKFQRVTMPFYEQKEIHNKKLKEEKYTITVVSTLIVM